MQRDRADAYARQRYRLYLGNRRDGPGFAYLILYVQQGGGGLPRCKFIGNGPTRVVCCVACPLLQVEFIYFDDHTVNLIGVGFALFLPLTDEIHYLMHTMANAPLLLVFRNFEAQRCQGIKAFAMGGKPVRSGLSIGVFCIAKGIYKGFEPSDSHFARVFHA